MTSTKCITTAIIIISDNNQKLDFFINKQTCIYFNRLIYRQANIDRNQK